MQSQLDVDDALIAQFLGPRYLGRRYLRYAELEALGLCDNRASLKNWMDAGGFPRGIKIPGPYGKTLVWHAVEVARLIAQRVRVRRLLNRLNAKRRLEAALACSGANTSSRQDGCSSKRLKPQRSCTP